MNISKLILVIFLFHYSDNISSQPKNDFILQREFAPMIDSLIDPPANSDEAWSLVVFDSVKNDYRVIDPIEEQDRKIQNIVAEITAALNSKKTNTTSVAPSTGRGPDGVPPGSTRPSTEGNRSDNLRDIYEDFQDANLALTRLTEIKEQFKNEIQDMQFKVNEKLHKTLKTDHDSHLSIINDFMQFNQKQYQKHKLALRENIIKIDGILKKYDFGSDVTSSRLRSEILKLQLSQSENLKFLSNITKEFTLIGAEFHEQKLTNSKN